MNQLTRIESRGATECARKLKRAEGQQQRNNKQKLLCLKIIYCEILNRRINESVVICQFLHILPLFVFQWEHRQMYPLDFLPTILSRSGLLVVDCTTTR